MRTMMLLVGLLVTGAGDASVMNRTIDTVLRDCASEDAEAKAFCTGYLVAIHDRLLMEEIRERGSADGCVQMNAQQLIDAMFAYKGLADSGAANTLDRKLPAAPSIEFAIRRVHGMFCHGD